MYIRDILNKKGISFEVFPPKSDADYSTVSKAVDTLAKMKADFMSVTYGAGGGIRKSTVKIASEIQDNNGVAALAHLTCVSSTKDEIIAVLNAMKEAKIENILALRGDIPVGSDFPNPGHFKYASDLITEIKKHGDFCIGGACYPEGHIECESKEKDLDNLKIKVSCGAEYLISQLFFDNNLFYDFLEKLAQKGINVPVLPGIMPVTSVKQIKRMCDLSGSSIPKKLDDILKKHQDDKEAITKAGIEYAVRQIDDLFENGVNHIHLYTMNNPYIAEKILKDSKNLHEIKLN